MPVLRCSQQASASPRFPPEAPPGNPKISAVRAYADAHVSVSAQNANYGKQRGLTVDARPMTRAYLRFGIDLKKGNVLRVNLLLYSRTRSQLGYQVRLATEGWRERRITFENAPRVSPRYVSSGRLRARAWKAVDITSLVGDDDERGQSRADDGRPGRDRLREPREWA